MAPRRNDSSISATASPLNARTAMSLSTAGPATAAAQRNGEGHLAQERAPGEPVAEAPAIGEPEIPRQSEKADEERQHADALADTVEGEVEMRIEERPRRVGEHRDAEERRGAQPEKPRKGPHGRFTTRLPPPPGPE